MKRFVVFVLCLFAIFVFAEETYKIYLNNGKVIVSDVKPDVKGDRIYFERFGMLLYIPVDMVDMKKTEKGEALLQETEKTEPKKQKKVLKIDEEQLEQIRQRSRLANEDELAALEYVSTEGETGVSGGGEAGQQGAVGELQKKLSSLMQQRSMLQGNVNSLMEELAAKRDQFGFATMAADKDRLQKEMNDIESRLTDARSKLSSVENQITATQQEIASTPIVLEAPSAKQQQPVQQQQTPPPTTEGE